MSAPDTEHRPATKAEVIAAGIDWPVLDYTGNEVAVCAVCWFSWPCPTVDNPGYV